jgi:SAM-dependent methyltransferase
MPVNPKPVLGDCRCENCVKTLQVVLERLQRVSSLRGHRLLDVGCGDGTFTIPAGRGYGEVYGIDIQKENVAVFRNKLTDDGKYHPLLMSACDMDFPDNFFDTIISLETFEHLEHPAAAAAECHRVLVDDGELVITVPNRWFPCENHGGRVLGVEFRRLPLITYLPWLHDRVANARVFTVATLDRVFLPQGFRRTDVGYLWPTFEHGGNPLQPLLRPFFPVMRALEVSRIGFLGTSIVARYTKDLRTANFVHSSA